MTLSSYRGQTVVLYFSEGVGCDACFYQMAEFEKHSADLSAAGVTLVPIVMNPAEQVRQEMTRFNLRTPFLIDANGAVSGEYGVLGKGMHQGLPGHGFVLIDASGTERWYGEYLGIRGRIRWSARFRVWIMLWGAPSRRALAWLSGVGGLWLLGAWSVHDRVARYEPGRVRRRDCVSDQRFTAHVQHGRDVEPALGEQLTSPVNFKPGIGAVNCRRIP